MDATLIGFLGCGGIAAIIWWLNGKLNIKDIIHKTTQDFKTEDIQDITDDQVKVKDSIKTKENLSNDSIETIKTIQKKANEDIQEVLKQNKIKDIHKEIDNDWDKI